MSMDNSSSDPFLSHACDQQRDLDAAHAALHIAAAIVSKQDRDLFHARAQVACLLVLCALALLGWWLS